jgi:hypothetical protein
MAAGERDETSSSVAACARGSFGGMSTDAIS